MRGESRKATALTDIVSRRSPTSPVEERTPQPVHLGNDVTLADIAHSLLNPCANGNREGNRPIQDKGLERAGGTPLPEEKSHPGWENRFRDRAHR